MESNIVRPDRHGRLSLERFGVQPGQVFEVSEDKEGRIHLRPVGEHEHYALSTEGMTSEERSGYAQALKKRGMTEEDEA